MKTVSLFDSMILCKFFRDIYPWELLGELIMASTGVDGSKKNLKTIAGTIAAKVREFNLKEGMTPKDEMLPKPFHKKLIDSGSVIKEEEMEQLLKDYIDIRGW